MTKTAILPLLLAFAIAGYADAPNPPDKEKPAVREKPNADLDAKAKAAVETEVLAVFKDNPEKHTLNFTVAAPGKIAATPAIFPFEIQRNSGERKSSYLSGYYDARSASVRLYDEDGETYVPAAEHLLVRSRGALARSPGELRPRPGIEPAKLPAAQTIQRIEFKYAKREDTTMVVETSDPKVIQAFAKWYARVYSDPIDPNARYAERPAFYVSLFLREIEKSQSFGVPTQWNEMSGQRRVMTGKEQADLLGIFSIDASELKALNAGVPDEPKPEKPPVIEKPTPEVQAKAEAAIKTSVIEGISTRGDFSRSTPRDFTHEFPTSAPKNVTATAAILPFDIRHSPRSGTGIGTVCLSGYYDAKSSSVRLYDQDAKAYVAAADHPFVKTKVGQPVNE